MITYTVDGDFKNLDKFLSKMRLGEHLKRLEKYGESGVKALVAATPKDTGKTAGSWSYDIDVSIGSTTITWSNSNVNDGVPIAIILQYGHGTGTGGWVAGYDYINPAIQPLFDKIADVVWMEVTKA